MTLHDKAVEAAARGNMSSEEFAEWGKAVCHYATATTERKIRAYLAAMAAAGSQEAAALLAQINAAPSPEDTP